ncbi:MAG: type II toxin-antitoxin system prevent-host-death family antitoxin [Gemmatimonadota bacterium]
MPDMVNVHETKTHLSRLLERVQKGEEIILARAGKPCARLVPFVAPSQRRPGLVKGRITEAFFEPLPPEELEAWER